MSVGSRAVAADATAKIYLWLEELSATEGKVRSIEKVCVKLVVTWKRLKLNVNQNIKNLLTC